jgi:hypothetical protein
VSYFGWDSLHAYRNRNSGRRSTICCGFALPAPSASYGRRVAVVARQPPGHRHRCVLLYSALYLLSLAMIAVTAFPVICSITAFVDLCSCSACSGWKATRLCAGRPLPRASYLPVFTQTTELVAHNIPEFLSKSLSYYNVAALLFLTSFSLIRAALRSGSGSARDAFAAGSAKRTECRRRRRRDTQVKTAALVKAKDELPRAPSGGVAKSISRRPTSAPADAGADQPARCCPRWAGDQNR